MMISEKKDFNDEETLIEGDFDIDKTIAEMDSISDNTISFHEAILGSAANLSPDQTIIMGRKKDAMAWIVKIKNNKVLKRYRLKEGHTTIGRNSRSDIVLDDREVSDIHAKIIIEKKSHKIFDTGSLNGTFLNGKKIANPKKLEDGDEIKIANITMIFKKI